MNFPRRILSRLLGPASADEIIGCIRRLQNERRISRTHRLNTIRAANFHRESLRLHMGCGHVYKPGWINIDSYHIPPCTPDLTLDLRRPLPFPDASCAEIYSEHFFEHLPYPHGADALLQEARRVLAPGGLISIGVPDPRDVLAAYLADLPCPYFDYFYHHPSVTRHLGTKMEAVNWLFRQGGEHHFIYDFASLEKMLIRNGFTRIVRRDFDAARDSEARRHGTLYVDAWK